MGKKQKVGESSLDAIHPLYVIQSEEDKKRKALYGFPMMDGKTILITADIYEELSEEDQIFLHKIKNDISEFQSSEILAMFNDKEEGQLVVGAEEISLADLHLRLNSTPFMTQYNYLASLVVRGLYEDYFQGEKSWLTTCVGFVHLMDEVGVDGSTPSFLTNLYIEQVTGRVFRFGEDTLNGVSLPKPLDAFVCSEVQIVNYIIEDLKLRKLLTDSSACDMQYSDYLLSVEGMAKMMDL